ncbi:MAG: DUF4019 domain-containing protein [Chthoniobacterales bacterium]
MLTKKSPLMAAIFTSLLITTFCHIVRAETPEAETKKAALTATLQWLGEIDQGDYAKSWQDASGPFKEAVTEEKWTSVSNSIRKPLGKLLSRKVASQALQEEIQSRAGMMKGPFVITQFETSFENMKYAIETVTFKKEEDGVWRSSGYYIKPR